MTEIELLLEPQVIELATTQFVSDGKVRISGEDTTPAFLEGKLLAGSNITLSKSGAGGNEKVVIAAAGGGSSAITKTFGESVSAYRCVFIGNDGEAYRLDSDDSTNAPAFAGIVTSAVVEGEPGSIATEGELTNSGWSFTPNGPVFVGLFGEVTQAVPISGFSLRLGFATSSTSILFNVADLTILG